MLAEAARLLRPGGVIALVDQDPESAVIPPLPAPIGTLLKSTEPYLEDYFRLDRLRPWARPASARCGAKPAIRAIG